MTDSVADKSGFLRMYMSNHPDTLVAYVRHFGKVTDPTIIGAEMTAIESKSMTLTYKRKNGQSNVVKVPFNPPLSGYDEVKPRLLGMKAEAQEALGMIKAPQITAFHFPTTGVWGVGAFLGVLVYSTLAGTTYIASPLFAPGRQLVGALGGWATVQALCWMTAVGHSLGALYTTTLVRRHRAPFPVAAKWILCTLALGFPGWLELRKRIQAARIESVMKVE
ncbi:hypothetical protein PLICRDRAFT_167267 [Plicaturopsis crispa FD-325 SS-3]|uniref:DUF2470 domain-containing protein n=1 Tax=Plicaturopsis crispa FD-325 SS-3 TaxID=944288 RepID=A0A0C9T9D7_PLICR|nr:hypothetical protein PLICRDRAFT_167267 [Plicaturopsis crispa FD-325 SS-3]